MYSDEEAPARKRCGSSYNNILESTINKTLLTAGAHIASLRGVCIKGGLVEKGAAQCLIGETRFGNRLLILTADRRRRIIDTDKICYRLTVREAFC
ncbi:hypothetical protein CEXT_682301 [Caerostris extrusa]|uniref:Uncharacterized protein n=1 Tax=Caerostris extrusa TaxID=172846 RepID=A0AAV4TQN2_CAEEX|nr:hypothetical protein CEXT_682301 [Caerostris extrusa]